MSQTRFVHGAKFFLPFVHEFSADFSVPPKFYGSVTEKYLSTGWAQTFVLQITNQILYIPLRHCILGYKDPMAFIVLLAGIFRQYL
jgi:hypothetical protein